MELPKVFAFYEDDNTIRVFQAKKDDDGLSLEAWSVPTNDAWKDATAEERLALVEWYRGDQWFPIETSLTDELDIEKHRVIIDEREYTWWRSTTELVWSNKVSIENQRVNLDKCLTKIPVLVFSPKFDESPNSDVPNSEKPESDTSVSEEGGEGEVIEEGVSDDSSTSTSTTSEEDEEDVSDDSSTSTSTTSEEEAEQQNGEEVEWLGNRREKRDLVLKIEINILGLIVFVLFTTLYYYILTKNFGMLRNTV